MERQQCSFAADLYATLSAACAVDACVPSRAPRSPSSPRRAPRQPCRRSLSYPALVPPIPANGASTAVPVGGAGGGAPVDTLAGTGAPAPTLHASLAGMRRDVANAGMNSVANVNMCLTIVGVASFSQLFLHKKEVVSVRLLQSGFTATDLDEGYIVFKGEKTHTAQRPTMHRPQRSPTISLSVSPSSTGWIRATSTSWESFGAAYHQS
jgi:hypothetical protein